MTWQWLVYIWLWGKEAEKKQTGLKLFLKFFLKSHISAHAGHPNLSTPSDLNVKVKINNFFHYFMALWNVAAVKLGQEPVSCQAQLSFLKKDEGRGVLLPKAWRQLESPLPFPSTYSNYRPAPTTIIMARWDGSRAAIKTTPDRLTVLSKSWAVINNETEEEQRGQKVVWSKASLSAALIAFREF